MSNTQPPSVPGQTAPTGATGRADRRQSGDAVPDDRSPGDRPVGDPPVGEQLPGGRGVGSAGGVGSTGGVGSLGQLHRMSRTAGVGTGDYAAINTLAVIGAALGVAGVLVIFSPLLLILPVGAVVASAVALIQIRRSNGTQSGLLVAVLGLLLGLGAGGWVAGTTLIEARQDAKDATQVQSVISGFGQDLATGDYARAYAYFHPKLQERIKSERLESIAKSFERYPTFGKIESFKSNGLLEFREVPGEAGTRQGVGIVLIRYKPNNPSPENEPINRLDMTFRQDDGVWKIYDIPGWFIASDSTKPGGGRPVGPTGPMAPGGMMGPPER